jgi:hypothetical protein
MPSGVTRRTGVGRREEGDAHGKPAYTIARAARGGSRWYSHF